MLRRCQPPLFTEQSAWASFLAQEEWRSLNAFDIDSLHASLDGVGLVDPTGVADAANAVLYAANGDLGKAVTSVTWLRTRLGTRLGCCAIITASRP